MDRRQALRVLSLGALGLLAACAPERNESWHHVDDPDVVSETQQRRSPSGTYLAAYEVHETTFVPLISTATQRDQVWRDGLTHSKRLGAGVMWEHDADVLWVLSRDWGHRRITLRDGVWQEEYSNDMPDYVRAHL